MLPAFSNLRRSHSVLAAALTIAAADGAEQTNTIEEVVVTAATGNRIVRQGDSPSPLSSYDGQTLLDSGLKDIRDLVGVLSINAGFSWRNTGNWEFNADYWRYSFEDVLRKENAQAIVNADPFDPRGRRLFVSFGLKR